LFLLLPDIHYGEIKIFKCIGKQSGESVESVLKKKMKTTLGKICRKRKVLAWNERMKV